VVEERSSISDHFQFRRPAGLCDVQRDKAAIVQMTRNMALDLAPRNIRVNCVCARNDLTRASYDHMERVGMNWRNSAEEGPKHLLNRVGTPREVAHAILFLASDEASLSQAPISWSMAATPHARNNGNTEKVVGAGLVLPSSSREERRAGTSLPYTFSSIRFSFSYLEARPSYFGVTPRLKSRNE
jgi:hypothetical protein